MNSTVVFILIMNQYSSHRSANMASNVVGDVKTIPLKSEILFRWKINNFLDRYRDVKEFLESPKFVENSVDSEIQWYLRWYLKDSEGLLNKKLMLFLYTTAEIKVTEISFGILNEADDVIVSKIEKKSCFCGTCICVELTALDFLNSSVNAILIYDKITIVCALTVILPLVENEIKLKIVEAEEQEEDVLSRLKDKYEALLNADVIFSDVSLISEGKAVKVHKYILTKSSTVFAAMLDAEMKEKQDNIVKIADIKYDVLVEIIRFLYTGKVGNVDTLAEELASAADKYALDGLKNTCEKSITEKNLSVDNVVEFLQFAIRLRMDKPKKKAIAFIIANSSHITDRQEFKSLPSDVLCEICSAMSKNMQTLLQCT